MIVADMPLLSYHINIEETVRNAAKLIQQCRAQAVKMEGGIEIIDKVKAVISAQIPVMGHIGLTPQSINVFGGFKVQGKKEEEAKKIIEDAIALDKAGVFAIVLEGIPEKLAEIVTNKVSVPTIGIGAGKHCDGQILVVNDMLGMYSDFTPKFVKKYAKLNDGIIEAIKNYIKEVKEESFPKKEHTFTIDESIIEKLY
jgi:3-methyl-2-oxobutanoate hydroxymethyltransferase